MQEQTGLIIEIKGQRAKVRVDTPKDGVKLNKQKTIVDAWNNIGAKKGQKIAFEIKALSSKYDKFMLWVMPVLSACAGGLFGGNFANYLDQPVLWGRILGAILWFVLVAVYLSQYVKDVRSRGEQPVLTRILE